MQRCILKQVQPKSDDNEELPPLSVEKESSIIDFNSEKNIEQIPNQEELNCHIANTNQTVNLMSTDKYGFVIAENMKQSIKKQQSLSQEQKLLTAKQQNARTEKWRDMLPQMNQMVQSRSSLLKERGRKGIPDGMRTLIWPILAQISQFKKSQLLDYQGLLNQKQNFKFSNIISLDVSRTFPNNINFMNENICTKSLIEVLNALSVSLPKLGYCQGMNFLTASLLMVTNDENVFWILYSVMTKYQQIEKYIDPNNLKKEFFVLEILLQQYMPQLYKLLKKENIESFYYATEWFMTQFSSILPLQLFYRVYDIFLIEGEKTLFRCALTILHFKQSALLLSEGFEDLLLCIRDTKDMVDYDVELFIKVMTTEFSFSRSRMQELYAQFKSKPLQ